MLLMIGRRLTFWFSCVFAALAVSVAIAEDTVEMISGAQLTGKMVEIRQAGNEFDFEVSIAGQMRVRTFPFHEVHAVTLNDKRHVLTAASDTSPGETQTRSREEVLEWINRVGSTPPAWLESTPLKYPKTLDLSWPLRPPTRAWRNQVNVGQYLWDFIHPNSSRWKSGVKLMYHEMSLHHNDAKLLERDRLTLGRMYFRMFQDYARAAFWIGQINPLPDNDAKIILAECFWRLGNEEIAMDLMDSRSLPIQAIKLLGDMGHTDRAIAMGRSSAGTRMEHMAWLLTADACRSAGRYDEAIAYYEKVKPSLNVRNSEPARRMRARAQESIQAIRLFEKADVQTVVNGTYQDQSIGYTGPVQIEVVVMDNRIEDVHVIQHSEKQFFSALTAIPKRIIEKQSVQGIDGVSGATITSQAIVNASAKALAQGSLR